METVSNRQNPQSLTNKFKRSPNIWADCPFSWINKHYPECITRWDLSKFGLIGTQTTQIAGPIPGTKVFATTAGSVSAVSAVNSVEIWGGAIDALADTDNDSVSLAESYPRFRLSGDRATSNRLWFEACIANSSLVTNGIGWMFGLAETEQWTLATGVPFNGSDAITNAASFVGFRKGEDALGVVDTVVSDRATSFTNVTGGTTAGGTTDVSALSAANVFHKFGMKYDPGNIDRTIRFYQDNVELKTAISKETLQAYTNLDANALGMIFAQICDSAGTAIHSYINWAWAAQLPPGIDP